MTDADPAKNRPVKPRRWWAALLIGLVSSIAGYLYVGRPRRALALAAISLAFLLALRNGLGGALATPAGWLAGLAAAAAVFLFALVDVARIAIGERQYRLRRWNRVWVYVLAAVAGALASNALVDPELGGFHAVRAFSTPSGSMAPTLEVGDYTIADMRAYERAGPQPGDVVVFDRYGDGAELWVKRVVAGPGDRVAIADGELVVNDAPARRDPVRDGKRAIETLANARAYVVTPGGDDGPEMLRRMETRTVPAGAYFVLGDNRGNSTDSRLPDIGFVPRARILGRLEFIYWSRDRGRIGARLR